MIRSLIVLACMALGTLAHAAPPNPDPTHAVEVAQAGEVQAGDALAPVVDTDNGCDSYAFNDAGTLTTAPVATLINDCDGAHDVDPATVSRAPVLPRPVETRRTGLRLLARADLDTGCAVRVGVSHRDLQRRTTEG